VEVRSEKTEYFMRIVEVASPHVVC